MGVAIKEILTYDEIEISSIQNKKIAIDSFNMLYQFLSSIRQADGSHLTDSKGNITSHLKGLFNRLVYFKKNNIKAVFIFDGIAPKLKEKERKLRLEKKISADKKYQEALDLDLMEDARKYSTSTSRLENYMIEEAKKLISLFGFAIINAPSEAEAQGAELVKESLVYASASQDFDSLLFGAKYLIRNLSVSSKRKIPGTSMYKDTQIEFYDLEKNLKNLNISNDELIIISILCGTDFNPGGIKGIGPKKALKLVREFRDKWDVLFNSLDWYSYFPYTWLEVFNTFKKIPVEKNLSIENFPMKKEEIIDFLKEKDFDEIMLQRSLSSIKNIKTLDNFFS